MSMSHIWGGAGDGHVPPKGNVGEHVASTFHVEDLGWEGAVYS